MLPSIEDPRKIIKNKFKNNEIYTVLFQKGSPVYKDK